MASAADVVAALDHRSHPWLGIGGFKSLMALDGADPKVQIRVYAFESRAGPGF
jgi:hypothetical protein